jgi:CRISPR-associated protein Cmr1
MRAIQLSYTVRFLNPAFLGNAEQSGQWRTPPFKALLRQWWRVAYAADHRFAVNIGNMSTEEGRLFGVAAAAGSSNKSRVRIRLDRWDPGRLRAWQPTGTVRHPEVQVRREGKVLGIGQDVGSDLYLGYGPLTFQRGIGTTLKTSATKTNAAIQPGETAVLRIALASDVLSGEPERITKSLALIHLYGTLGGRSRNGWGSFVLEALEGSPALPLSPDASVQRSWRQALELDWPHAIGEDQKGALIWQTSEGFTDWKPAMRRLAGIKIGLRTQFKFTHGVRTPQDRHWLSYPVTHHEVDAWDRDRRPLPSLRLPNSLRFKLRRDSGDAGRLRGIIFHVPCLPPSDFKPNSGAIVSVWQRVHEFLDDPAQKLSRIPA